MKALILVAVPAISMVLLPAAAGADEEGFVTLFNGRDLTGWKTAPTSRWVVEDGTITLKDRSDGREHNDDYLWTEKTYADFTVELEFKIPERANSGVFLRTANLKDPVYTGIEVQVCNSYGREGCNRGGTAGAIYDCLAPTMNVINKPGQWNRYRITCQDNKISVVLNGRQVIDMDLNRWSAPEKNPDGTPNKFPRALKDFARRGHIGLQDHGLPVWYRNIRIKRLKNTAGFASARDQAKGSFTLLPDRYGKVLKLPDGRTMFRYMTKKPERTNLTANSVCCLYPLYTPAGQRAVDFAPGDHRHHRGVFLAWHAMEGKQRADFWGWGQFAPTENRVIRNRSVKLLHADSTRAELRIRNDWVAKDEVMLKELLSVTARQQDQVFVIDLDFQLTATVDVTLEQTAFGGFCVKGRKDGKAVYSNPEGPVNLPRPHHLKPESDWPAADWYDYTIDLESGKVVGVAVLDHPDNPPTTWHNLAPIAMLNPCIVAPGPLTVKQGRTLTLRYRLVVHDGPAPAELLNQLSKQWRQN